MAESGTVVPLLKSAASALWVPPLGRRGGGAKGERSKGVGGTLPCLTQPPTKSCWIATFQKHITSKGGGRSDHISWCVKIVLAKHTVKARTYCISAFRLAVYIQHSIKKVSRVTKLLNALGEKDTLHYWPLGSIPLKLVVEMHHNRCPVQCLLCNLLIERVCLCLSGVGGEARICGSEWSISPAAHHCSILCTWHPLLYGHSRCMPCVWSFCRWVGVPQQKTYPDTSRHVCVPCCPPENVF